VTARINLSEGFELIGGNTEWKGDFIGGHSYTLQASIKAIKTGTWVVEALAVGPTPGDGIGAVAVYVAISETDASISDRP
jgi:hypothetical protein